MSPDKGLKTTKVNLTEEQLKAWRTWRALCHADENGDGYINEKEFDELVKYAVKCGYAIS
ncbi:hypothetical protein Patl1_08979 [Pistacia atlantica]|uniref:Uncharacterized protein n=1 Tax=Pistacia atlantica TaxID=434234 RepID=A0ACC1AD89_9ROSI|nr:hypothetical protein Patl1_08979 [Pistacia atlantica]